MSQRTYSILGIAIPFVFLITYLAMSLIRPEYSMLTKAISELGSLDAPNKWIWNIFGYILPGILIAIYANELYKNVVKDKASKLPLYGIMMSGVFMAISGLFPGDFDNRGSLTMTLHTIGSIGSYVFFLIGAFTYPKLMQQTIYWKKVKNPTLIFTYLTIVLGSWPFIFPNVPAVGQRLVFFFYFLWIFYTAMKLYKRPRVTNMVDMKSS